MIPRVIPRLIRSSRLAGPAGFGRLRRRRRHASIGDRPRYGGGLPAAGEHHLRHAEPGPDLPDPRSVHPAIQHRADRPAEPRPVGQLCPAADDPKLYPQHRNGRHAQQPGGGARSRRAVGRTAAQRIIEPLIPGVTEARTLRDADALVAAGLVAPGARDAVAAVERRYAVAVPAALRALIERPDDPIGRQFIPDPAELVTAAHERTDPIGDEAFSPIKGIVHRYPDRALLKPLLACPVYCRFCFRREHVGPDGGLLSPAELSAAYAWLAARPAIQEVILTGEIR